jgi:hypothetical protein
MTAEGPEHYGPEHYGPEHYGRSEAGTFAAAPGLTRYERQRAQESVQKPQTIGPTRPQQSWLGNQASSNQGKA